MSEHDLDKLQLMVKRMTYTIYKAMYNLIMFESIATVISLMVALPLFAFAVSRVVYIRRIVRRRGAYLDNPKKLKDKIDAKVEAAAKKASDKERKKQEAAIQQAKEKYTKMQNLK